MAISVTASSSVSVMLSSTTKHHHHLFSSSSSSNLSFSSSSSSRFNPLPCFRTTLPARFTKFKVEAKKQTFTSFEDLLDKSDKPVLVDFYATWCGPCQLMVPILNEVGETMQDKIQIVKIDTEKYPAIANKYQIQALPTFIVFKNREPSDRFEGALPADQLVKRIEVALEAKQ